MRVSAEAIQIARRAAAELNIHGTEPDDPAADERPPVTSFEEFGDMRGDSDARAGECPKNPIVSKNGTPVAIPNCRRPVSGW